MSEFPSADAVDQVLGMFPDISRFDVSRDLNITRSVEGTINRILDGTVRS